MGSSPVDGWKYEPAGGSRACAWGKPRIFRAHRGSVATFRKAVWGGTMRRWIWAVGAAMLGVGGGAGAAALALGGGSGTTNFGPYVIKKGDDVSTCNNVWA